MPTQFRNICLNLKDLGTKLAARGIHFNALSYLSCFIFKVAPFYFGKLIFYATFFLKVALLCTVLKNFELVSSLRRRGSLLQLANS